MPSPVDFDPVPFMRWLVVAFGLVCTVTQAVCAYPGIGRTIAEPFRTIFEFVKRQLQFRSSLRLSPSRLSY